MEIGPLTKSVLYRCPSCVGEFSYLHHPSIASDPAPRFCPLCGFDTESEALEQPPVAPAIGNAHAASLDQVYHQMEAGAAYRAELAGEPSLKITDLKDNLRAGDTSYVPVQNDVTRAMERQPGNWGFSAQNGLAQSQQAHTGYMPNAGLRALTGIRKQHGAGGNVVSDLPALETQQALYRPRLT